MQCFGAARVRLIPYRCRPAPSGPTQRGGNAAARIAEARALHERALRVRGAALGPHHPATASSLNNLANLVARSGDAAEAERLLRRALAAREAALGPAHADTSATLHNLARQLERRGEIDEAEELYARALRIREDALGDHPFTASSLSVLGRLLAKRGRGGDALPLLRRALAIREAVLRPGHPDALGSMRDLGKCLQGLGQSEEAEALLRASRPPPPPYWGVSGGRGSGGGFGGSGGGARGWGQGAPADGPWVRGSQFQLSVRPAAQAQHRQPQAQAPAMPQEQLSQQQEPKQREQPHAPEPPQQEQRQQQQQQPAAEQQSWPDHFPAFPGAAPAPAAALTSPFACFAACPSPQQTLSGACATPLGRLAQPQICASLAPGGGAAADSSADRTGGGSGGDISNGGGGGGGQVALNQAIISDLGVLEFDAAAIRRATQPPRRPLAEGEPPGRRPAFTGARRRQLGAPLSARAQPCASVSLHADTHTSPRARRRPRVVRARVGAGTGRPAVRRQSAQGGGPGGRVCARAAHSRKAEPPWDRAARGLLCAGAVPG